MQADVFTYRNPSASAQQGPLKGKSFVIQPNMSVRGWHTEAGSVALKGFIAVEDATVIERLEKAGAAMVGSTRMSELGLGLHGDTTGLALSGGETDMALMTDMMGEARITASRIKTYGFKPTSGIVSRFGLIGLVPSMECFGIIARVPKDISLAMETIASYDDRDFSMYSGEMPSFSQVTKTAEPITTIGIIKECLETLDEGETRAFRNGLDRLKVLGYALNDLCLPDFDIVGTVHHIIGSVEASSSCGKYDGVRYGHRTAAAVKSWNDMYIKTRAESFGPLIKSYLFQGAYFQFENYAAFENASRIRARLVNDLDGLFKKVDAIAFPTGRRKFQAAARTLDDIYHECSLTLLANVMGLPAVQVPGLVLDGNTDLGLQIIGSRLSDARLLSLVARVSNTAEGV